MAKSHLFIAMYIAIEIVSLPGRLWEVPSWVTGNMSLGYMYLYPL